MVELIFGSFVDSLAGRVLSSLFDEIGLTRGVKLEFNKLVATLSLIRGYLQDAEKRQVDDEALKFWLKQLQDLAYETDDLLDDFNTEAISRRTVAGARKKMVNEVSIFFSSSNQLIYANRMAHRIKDLKENLDFLRNLAGLFNLQSVSKSPSLVERHHGRPLTVPYDYEPYVIGRDQEKENVKDFLLDSKLEGNLSILPIVGFGGLGKTTLAREVFKNVQAHFQKQIWVCVSTNFVVEEILQKIVGPCSEKGDKLHEKLEKELGGKKYFLVLDDVWNENESKWSELIKKLPPCAKGSRMLVTTRSHAVANIVVNTIDKRQCKLSGLNEKGSLELLMRMTGKQEVEWKNEKIEIAKQILIKCGGVPLAIMTIGRLLSSRLREAEWSDLLAEDFSRIEQKEGDIMPTLKISYDFLPSHLKQCFTYCCLFPKDYELDPNELVHLWMAQGFIFKSRGSSKTLHDVGKEYFMELASRSFFQDVERDPLGNITGCKMHDLMHDLATMVAGDNYTTIVNGSGASDEDIPKEVRHVSMGIDRGSYNLKSLGPNQRIIRSLLFINHYHRQEKTLSGDISSFRNLRALRLHRLAKGDVLRSIGKLKHLRSLDLSDSDKLTSLPNSIGKLLNLETLILNGCWRLKSLPRGVTKLINLRYLDMRGCDSLTCTQSGMGNLTNLEIIKLSSCYYIKSIPPLDQLPSLKSISLDDLKELEWIEVTENSICLYPSLRELELARLPMFKGWKRKRMNVNRSGDQSIHSSSSSSLFFIPSFSRKVHVLMYRCGMLYCTWNDKKGVSLQVGGMKYKDLEEELCRRNRSNVKEEEEEECSSISTTQMGSLTLVPLSSVPLHKVTSLSLHHLDDTEELPMELFQSLCCLQSLNITECHHIKSIPSLDQLSSLESINLSHCNNMRSIPHLDQLPSLKSIELSICENIRSIPPLDQLSSLESISLSYCDNMRSIPPLDQLPSLKSISLEYMEKLEWIEVTENNSICLYPSLIELKLGRLPMLKGWKMKSMDVYRSGDQTIHSSSSSLFFIPSFSKKVHVQIDYCGMLSYMRDDNEGVLLQLIRMKYKDLEELWGRNRRNVEEEEECSSISTTQMGSLTLVPLSSVPLHTVTSLSLHHLDDTEELPMELFQSLSHLQSLKITECHYIGSIPPLDQLPSLKSISLDRLRELEWIEVTENKSICLYPSLERVYLRLLPMLKGWKRKRMDVNRSGDQTIHSSPSLFYVPSFSRKVDVEINFCKMLSYMRDDNEEVLLQVGGMKYKDLEEELCRRNMSNVKEEEECSSISTTQMGSLTFVPLSSVPLHTVTHLHLINLEDTEELPLELFRSLSRLQSLEITDCHRLKSLSGWAILRYLCSLKSLEIHKCNELDLSSMDQEEDNKAIQGIPNSQTKMKYLNLFGMDKMKTLPPWIQYLPKLETLLLDDCKNMETLPGWFSQLTSLKRLQVVNCGELSRKCRKDTGEWWPRISHIEDVNIQ